MLNLLIKPLLGVAGEVVTGIVETKKKKAEVKLKKIEAEAAHMDKVIAGEAEWESAAVKQMAGSWKDEVSLIVLLIPAVLVFIPGCQEFVRTGFIALQELPSYYQNLLYIAISSSFGMKAGQSAFKMFKKK